MNYKLSEVESIPLQSIKGIDKLALLNPEMQDREYQQLLLDMRLNGQLDAITLHRGFIVDGRHRYKALVEIDPNGTIKSQKLPHKVDREIKRNFIISKENRRMQTITQKTCRAVLQWNTDKPEGMTQKIFVKHKGVSIANFSNAQWIYKNNLPLIEKLIVGEFFKLDEYATTDSLLAIVKYLKAESRTEVPKDIPHTGLDFNSQRINETVNYHVNALLGDISRMDLPDDDKNAHAMDIATQLYSMFKTQFDFTKGKTIVGSELNNK